MEKLAEKFVFDHNNPLKKVELPATKDFLSLDKQNETEKYLKNIENSLKHNRVDRRCARTKAIWLPDQQVAKITKRVRLSAHYGYENRDGKFLYPEEILYLLEINRLEIVYDEIPLSVQEMYEICLKNGLTLEKYLVYKKLTLQGYRVVKKLKIERNSEESEEEPCCKIPKLDTSIDRDDKFIKVFAQLREKAPKNVKNNTQSSNPDYYVFLPTTTGKKPDFRLFIIDSIDTITRNFTDEIPGLFAVFSKNREFIGFHRCEQVDIPDLS